VAHANPVAEDRAARIGTGRVDRDHAHLAALSPELFGQLRDQGRLAAARHAGNSDDVRAAGKLVYFGERRPRFRVTVLRTRDQTGDSRSLAGLNSGDEIGGGHLAVQDRALSICACISANTFLSSMTRRALKSVRAIEPGSTISTTVRRPSTFCSF